MVESEPTVINCIQQLINVFHAVRLDENSSQRNHHDEEILSLLSHCHILPSIKIRFNLTPFGSNDDDDFKEFPLHIACAVGCSFGVTQLIYHLFPSAIFERSPTRSFGEFLWSDLLPLHYACIYGASAKTISFLIRQYPKSRHSQASIGTCGFQRPFNFCFWRDCPLEWNTLIRDMIVRDNSFVASIEAKGDIYFEKRLNVDRLEQFTQLIQPVRKDIVICAKTSHCVNHIGITLDESLAVEDSLVLKLHPKDEDWGEILLTLEAISIPIRWLEIRTGLDFGTIPKLSKCLRNFKFKGTMEQIIVDALVENEQEMNDFLETLLIEFPNVKSLGLAPSMKWFSVLVDRLKESNCSLRHVIFGPEYPLQSDPLIKKQVDYYCTLNQLGRGIFKKDTASKEELLKVLDSCINQSVSILYGMLRFHPAKWSILE